jgi:hypothetical protein
VQPDQRDPVSRDNGRQQLLDLRVPVTGQRRHRHGVEARVLAGGGADVRVGVDPDDGEVVAVAAGKFRERGDTDRALAAPGDDPGRVVPANDLQGLGELREDDLLGLDPIGQLQAAVVHGDRRGRGRAVAGR